MDAVSQNRVVMDVLDRADEVGLPNRYLTAGCLFQTVWNVLEGHEPTRGIQDYDLFYFDDGDISWNAEDVAIRRSAAVFDGCGGDVEVRNEARVHLWYEEKFGTACRPYTSTEDAIDRFASTTCCFGIRSVSGELAI